MKHGLICDTSVKYLHILQHDQFTSANVYNNYEYAARVNAL